MTKRMLFWPVQAIVLAVILAGCGSPVGPGTDPIPDPVPDPSAWTITVKQSSPVPDPNYWVYILDRTPLLDWADITDASTYEIQVAPEYADVNNPNVTGSTAIIECSTSSYQVTAAYDWNTDWFWRVRAVKADGTVSAWAMPFQFYVSQSSVIVPFPADNGQTEDTTPILDWNDIAGAVSYDLTLASNADRVFYEVFTVTGLTDSEYELTAGQAITPGTTNYWYVRGKNDDGEYGEWSTDFGLTVRTNDVPVGNLRDAVVTIDKTPELTWNAISGATRYDIFIADSAAELDTVIAVQVATPTYTVPTPWAFGTHKYWRIKAYNLSGIQTGLTSADFDFTVATAYHPLGTPNGECGPTQPTLAWTKMLGTDTYDLEIARDVDFHDLVETASPTTASWTISAAVNQGSSRFWRIRARNEDGDTTAWSPGFCFTVRWTYTITPTAPTNGSTIFDQTPLLDWSDVSFSHTYEVWVCDRFPIVPTFSTKYTTTDTLSKLQLASALPMEATRYWRVRPKNLDGVVGSWSSTFELTPSATVALNPMPADGFTDTDTTPMVSWSAVPGAASYSVQTATSAAGVSGATAVDKGTGTSHTFTSPLPEGSYRYWRVQAKNDSGTGSVWTAVASVGVTWSYTPSPTPADGGDETDKTPLLSWSAIAGASSYELQANLGSAPSDGDHREPCASNSYQVPSTLLAGQTWYWRIRPINSEGFPGLWAKTWTFNVK